MLIWEKFLKQEFSQTNFTDKDPIYIGVETNLKALKIF